MRPVEVIGGEAREAHRASLHAAHAGAEGVLLAHRAGDDGLEVHDDVFKEVLRQIGAVEADALVRIAAVVVVPVEQRAGRLAGQRERVHAHHAADVDFARGGEEVLAHHAHHRAGHHAEVLLHRRPALDRGDGAVGLLHPAFDHRAELGHLQERGLGDVVGGDVLLDGGELGLDGVVRVLQPVDAAEDLGQIEGFYGDAGAFEQLLRIANGIEGGRTRANGADAQIAEAADDAADRCEPGEVLREALGVGRRGVQRGDGVRDAVLLHVVAGRHLAAEAIAAIGDLHVVGAVGRRLHQHRHLQRGVADGIDDAALLAEVRERDEDAVDLVAMLAEELRATARFIRSLYRAEL